jgi:hypothetical protein
MMIHLAEVATDVAQGLDPRGYGAKRVADFRARAWGELANSYRVADRWRSSQEAFGQAYAFLQRGTGDLYLKARLLELESSLLGVLQEYYLALRRLEIVADIYRGMGENHLAGRATISHALYTYYSGKVGEAAQLNAQGMALVDRERDPVLHMMAVHNHLMFLVDLGQYSRAKRILFDNQRHLLYRGRIGAMRFRTLEGQINYGLGKFLSAEIAFREAKEGFAEAGMSFHSGLLALQHAMALLCQDRSEEAAAEVIEAREIFLAHGIYREFLGSVIFLEECFERHEATVELVEVTVAYLWRKRLEAEPHKLRS